MVEAVVCLVIVLALMGAGAYLEGKLGDKLKARVAALEADLAALKAKL